MALKKPNFEAPEATTAAATAVAEPQAAAPAPADPAPTQEAKVEAGNAIAKASQTALSTQEAAARAKQFKREVEEMRGASDFTYGNYQVFKGNNGSIRSSEPEDDLGRWAKVRLLSWDDHYEVSPGEQGASTKDFVAYSKDGKTIDQVIGDELKAHVGTPVEAYLKYLTDTEGFKNAKCRRFIDTACALLATDSGDGPLNKVVQITLSESSIPAFSRYQQDLQDNARCVAMGLPGFTLPEDPFTFFFLREVATKGQNNWTKLKIVSTLPAKI